QPLAVKKRRLVLVPGVAEKRDELLASAMLLRETDSTGDVDPAGKSEEQTFFAQKLVDDRQRSLVIDAVSFINRDAFNVFRHTSLPDAFCNRVSVVGVSVAIGEPRPHGSAIGIGAHRGNIGILFLQVKRSASQCAAGADRGNKGAYLAAGLFPDFLAGAAVMGFTISSVVELIRPNPATLLSVPSC